MFFFQISSLHFFLDKGQKFLIQFPSITKSKTGRIIRIVKFKLRILSSPSAVDIKYETERDGKTFDFRISSEPFRSTSVFYKKSKKETSKFELLV